MKEVEVRLANLRLYRGTSAYQSESVRQCCRCGKQIEDADDERGDGERTICFWCAFVDTQG